MATTEVRVEANRKNAQHSSGPRTPEGKAVSRRNALKHGLTGEGVVLPVEDVAEVSRRFTALEDQLNPSDDLGLAWVQRVALLTVRLERSAKEESGRLGEAIRHAQDTFDDKRRAEVEQMMDWIAAEPATHSRRLRRTPEGVDLLIKAWLDLDADLCHPQLSRWAYSQWQRIENLNGRRSADFPMSREGALCNLIWGDASFLAPGEVDGMDAIDRRDWARDQLRERIAV